MKSFLAREKADMDPLWKLLGVYSAEEAYRLCSVPLYPWECINSDEEPDDAVVSDAPDDGDAAKQAQSS